MMWPFISQPAPLSLILFYSQHRDLTGGGGEKGISLIVSFILTTYGYHLFKLFFAAFDDHPHPEEGKFSGLLPGSVSALIVSNAHHYSSVDGYQKTS